MSVLDLGADEGRQVQHKTNHASIDTSKNRYTLKKVNKLVLLDFSDATIILTLPFPLKSASRTTGVFVRSDLRARGTKVGLMSSMGSKVMGHTSPSATCLANDGSMSLDACQEAC